MNELIPCDIGMTLSIYNEKHIKALIVVVELIQCINYCGILSLLEKKDHLIIFYCFTSLLFMQPSNLCLTSIYIYGIEDKRHP